MPLNFLLWNCLDPGKTSCGERGKGAALRPSGNECVLVFAVDNDSFRSRFDVKQVCDSLFFYSGQQQEPVLLLVELKGGDIAHGADQLAETLTAVRDALKQKKLAAQYRAVLITSSRALKNAAPLQKHFEKQHGIPLAVTRNPNLRPHL